MASLQESGTGKAGSCCQAQLWGWAWSPGVGPRAGSSASGQRLVIVFCGAGLSGLQTPYRARG